MINVTFEQDDQELNESTLMSMADEMASAATTFHNNGYENFLLAREQFKQALHDFSRNK